MIYYSPLGIIHIEITDGAVVALRFVTHAPIEDTTHSGHDDTVRSWLDSYFAGDTLPSMPAYAPSGTYFQKKVWAEISRIPFGHTATYGEIARAIGSSARAVGQAVGANPIAIHIPCHRVVAAGGHLGGYAYGTAIKQALLALEAPKTPIL